MFVTLPTCHLDRSLVKLLGFLFSVSHLVALNIPLISFTFTTCHFDRSLVKLMALANIRLIFFTFPTCHFDRSLVKLLAPLNVEPILFTLPTCHCERSSSKSALSWNNWAMLVIWLTSHWLMCPYSLIAAVRLLNQRPTAVLMLRSPSSVSGAKSGVSDAHKPQVLGQYSLTSNPTLESLHILRTIAHPDSQLFDKFFAAASLSQQPEVGGLVGTAVGATVGEGVGTAVRHVPQARGHASFAFEFSHLHASAYMAHMDDENRCEHPKPWSEFRPTM